MQRELVAAPAFWTVGQMIDFMRASDHLPELFYDIIVVDPAMRPIGVAALSRVMGQPRTVVLSEIMEEDFRVIRVDAPSEQRVEGAIEGARARHRGEVVPREGREVPDVEHEGMPQRDSVCVQRRGIEHREQRVGARPGRLEIGHHFTHVDSSCYGAI